MKERISVGVPMTDVLKALGDPIRWDIVARVAAAGELPCAELESILPISKPTISYHTKVLSQAGLLGTRKQGRNFFYTLNRAVLDDVVDGLGELSRAARSTAAQPAAGER